MLTEILLLYNMYTYVNVSLHETYFDSVGLSTDSHVKVPLTTSTEFSFSVNKNSKKKLSNENHVHMH